MYLIEYVNRATPDPTRARYIEEPDYEMTDNKARLLDRLPEVTILRIFKDVTETFDTAREPVT